MSEPVPPDAAQELSDDPDGGRRSKILGGASRRTEGLRTVVIALISTFVFFSVVAYAIVHSPNWPAVRHQFFDRGIFVESLPLVLRAFWTNVLAFMIAEAFILPLALILAVMRSLRGPVFFPIRALAVVYIDLFRGVPTILVIALLGFGVPGLQLPGVPTGEFFWGVVSLVLVYSAYVAEVYRAGIDSIHESQVAAARSLGLSRWQSMRHVVLPQAVRRVIPPLLNDFIGLQKDTALLAIIGVVEAFRISGIEVSRTFNYTPYVVCALLFILITIPLARCTDYVIARGRRRRMAGGTA